MRGTIRNVNTAAHLIELDLASGEQVQGQVQGFDTTNGSNATAIASYTSTIVEYQRRRFGLERGDIVDIDVSQSGNGYLARRITVAQAR